MTDHLNNTQRHSSQESELQQRLNLALAERDVAEAKLAEVQRKLMHMEKMASLGQLSAGVAHEINNPVSFVLSNTGTLSENLKDLIKVLQCHRALTQQRAEDDQGRLDVEKIEADIDLDYLLEDIQSAVRDSVAGLERIREIIRDLGSFARHDNDGRQKFDLNACIEEAIRITRPRWKNSVELKTEFGDLPDIYAAQGRIGQIFVNLIINAAQAIIGEGTITVRTYWDGQNAVAEVMDTGIGIVKEHLTDIFSPFFTTKPAGEGTGLGLAVSAGIIKQHGGTLEVESEPAKGTCFRLSLPGDLRGDLRQTDSAEPGNNEASE